MPPNPQSGSRHSQSPSKVKAYAQLFRLPNVFTAMADIVAGYFFVQPHLQPAGVFLSLLIASSLIYTSGMVLNDVFDVAVDSRQRPFRPIPSGRVPLGWARWMGFQMLAFGVALAWIAGYLYFDLAIIPWRSGAVAMVLAVSVLAYDAWLKRTPFGPVAMGACRFFNLLLGMSAATSLVGGTWNVLGYSPGQLVAAGGIGLYIVGVTWFARTEAVQSNRTHLSLATGVLVAGIVLLAALPLLAPNEMRFQVSQVARSLKLSPALVWQATVALLAAAIVRRCIVAVYDPTPARVQSAVKFALVSLILLDATIALAARGPIAAMSVLILILPTLTLGRWVYST